MASAPRPRALQGSARKSLVRVFFFLSKSGDKTNREMAEVDEASVKLDFQNFGLSGENAAIDGRIGRGTPPAGMFIMVTYEVSFKYTYLYELIWVCICECLCVSVSVRERLRE